MKRKYSAPKIIGTLKLGEDVSPKEREEFWQQLLYAFKDRRDAEDTRTLESDADGKGLRSSG